MAARSEAMARTYERRPSDGQHPSRRAARPIPGPSDDVGSELDALREALGNAAMSRMLDRRTSEAIEAELGGGQPLPGATADGDQVRLHDDSSSADLAKGLGAVAFTFGRDIFLAADAPDLDSPAGDRLLRHELTHVRQQQASGATRPRRVSAPRSPAERQAAAAAGPAGASLAPAGPQTVHRQATDEEEEEVRTMTAETVHRATSIEELEVAAEEGEEQSPAPAEQAGADTASGETNAAPADRAWDASIDSNLAAALAAMRQQPPDPRAAYDAVGRALTSAEVLAEGFQTTDVFSHVRAEQLIRHSRQIMLIKRSIGPHIGITVPPDIIIDNLAVTLSDARVLGGSSTETPNEVPATTPQEPTSADQGSAEPTAAGATASQAGAGPASAEPTAEQAPDGGAAAGSGEPAQPTGPAADAQAAGTNEAAGALYQAAVMDKVRAAEFSLLGEKPDPLAAVRALRDAAQALKVLQDTYQTSDPPLSDSIRASRNSVLVMREILIPMAGGQRTIGSDVLPLIPDVMTRIIEIRDRLH